MTQKEFTIHSAQINNHCPNCFAAKSLTFSFFQNQKENSWYVQTLAKVRDELFCTQCKEIIYPSSWDEHIERVFAYHKKLSVPKKAGYRIKVKALWALLILIISIAALGLWTWIRYWR
ncbi:hypothetical protein OAP25_00220 [Flavobacteriaceae bacterium]|jgi:hypothetical protein|nr:hypothetical protein [Flavobacteriaceae bacterium]MDC0637097.1 hypothetical protein [Flavobacteriaceae bacterium]